MDFTEFLGLIFFTMLYCYAFGVVLRGLLSWIYYTKDVDDALKVNFKND